MNPKWNDAYNTDLDDTLDNNRWRTLQYSFNSIQFNWSHSIQFDLIQSEVEICLDKSSSEYFFSRNNNTSYNLLSSA